MFKDEDLQSENKPLIKEVSKEIAIDLLDNYTAEEQKAILSGAKTYINEHYKREIMKTEEVLKIHSCNYEKFNQ